MAPLSLKTEAGKAPGGAALWKVRTTSRAGGHKHLRRDAQPRVVVVMFSISTSCLGEDDVGGVGLPRSLGSSATKRCPTSPRALVGLGGDEPPGLEHPPDRRHRRRVGVAALGQVAQEGLRPGVEPGSVSSLRSATISSSKQSAILVGE